jgi:ribonucleoside-triphosphate reductase
MSDTCGKCGRDLIDVCPICHKSVETYSRVVGYLRPISTWNEGKQEEYRHRTDYTFWGEQKIDKPNE